MYYFKETSSFVFFEFDTLNCTWDFKHLGLRLITKDCPFLQFFKDPLTY